MTPSEETYFAELWFNRFLCRLPIEQPNIRMWYRMFVTQRLRDVVAEELVQFVAELRRFEKTIGSGLEDLEPWNCERFQAMTSLMREYFLAMDQAGRVETGICARPGPGTEPEKPLQAVQGPAPGTVA